MTLGEVQLPILLGELQEVFATTGDVHWGDATDARLLCDALDLGFFMFADDLQARGARASEQVPMRDDEASPPAYCLFLLTK